MTICQTHDIEDTDALVSYGQCYVCAREKAETIARINAYCAAPGVLPCDPNVDWRCTVFDYLSRTATDE